VAARFLIDTNVLVYPHDGREPEKAARASTVLQALEARQSAALPAQALSEFSSVLLRKLEPPVPALEVSAQVERLMSIFPVLPLTPFVVLEAVRGVREHGFSFYDAQIWAVARLAQIPVVLSEDFQDGATHEGVTFRDPFKEAFGITSIPPAP